MVLSVPGLLLLNRNKPDKTLKNSLTVYYIYTIIWILCIIIAIYMENK